MTAPGDTSRWLLAEWFEHWADTQPDHFAVRGGDGRSPGRDLSAWARYTTSGCTVITVRGDHHSMLAPPHLHDLAEHLLEPAVPSAHLDAHLGGA